MNKNIKSYEENLNKAKENIEKLKKDKNKLKNEIHQKEEEFRDIVTIGRTHLMDATPITLGNEFSAFKEQVSNGLRVIKNSLSHLMELPIGGTAVGTGLNAPAGFDALAAAK